MRLRSVSCLAVVVATTAVPAPTAYAQDVGGEEIREAVEAGLSVSSALAGDRARFLTAVQQYGRLDLLVLASTWSPPKARGVRDFFYGAVSGPAKIDALELVKQFEECGHGCRAARQDSLVAAVDLARWLAESVRKLHGASVIAAWPDGWVVDSLACTPTGCTMRQASPVLGLVPWREHPTDSAAARAWLLAIGTTPAQMDSTTRLMRARHLVAVARDVAGDVRVILAGGMRADGAGLLFIDPGRSPPIVGAVGRAGDRYVAVTQIAPGVYFYETN